MAAVLPRRGHVRAGVATAHNALLAKSVREGSSHAPVGLLAQRRSVGNQTPVAGCPPRWSGWVERRLPEGRSATCGPAHRSALASTLQVAWPRRRRGDLRAVGRTGRSRTRSPTRGDCPVTSTCAPRDRRERLRPLPVRPRGTARPVAPYSGAGGAHAAPADRYTPQRASGGRFRRPRSGCPAVRSGSLPRPLPFGREVCHGAVGGSLLDQSLPDLGERTLRAGLKPTIEDNTAENFKG